MSETEIVQCVRCRDDVDEHDERGRCLAIVDLFNGWKSLCFCGWS